MRTSKFFFFEILDHLILWKWNGFKQLQEIANKSPRVCQNILENSRKFDNFPLWNTKYIEKITRDVKIIGQIYHKETITKTSLSNQTSHTIVKLVCLGGQLFNWSQFFKWSRVFGRYYWLHKQFLCVWFSFIWIYFTNMIVCCSFTSKSLFGTN